MHLSMFAALAAATRWRFGPGLLGLALVAAYAPASELVQAYLLPDRAGDVRDVVADLSGVALGWALSTRALARTPC